MLQVVMNSKPIKIAYGIVFPIVVITLLLIIASLNNRPMLFGSITFDFVIRIIMSIWFCGLYIRLSRISSFSFYPNKKWVKADLGKSEIIFNIGMSLVFSFGVGIITFWVIRWFLPVSIIYAYMFASVNSLIVLLPLVTQFEVIKL